jgi:hypothetical protein
VLDLDREIGGQPIGDQGAVACLRIAFHAYEGRGLVRGQLGNERAELYPREDLAQIALPVLGRQLGARALRDTEAVVLAVLQLPELSGRRQLLLVPVADPDLGERGLEPVRVGPRVLRATDASTLTDVEQQDYPRVPERIEKRLGRPPVDADRPNAASAQLPGTLPFDEGLPAPWSSTVRWT